MLSGRKKYQPSKRCERVGLTRAASLPKINPGAATYVVAAPPETAPSSGKLRGCGPVENYEIRIRKNGGGPVIYTGTHLSDVAAVRRARAIAGATGIVEVWRGDDCIYARNVDHSPARALMAIPARRE
jgi:hypothetical protein